MTSVQPVLEEILRAKLPIRPDVLRRWQAEIQRYLVEASDAAGKAAHP